MLIARSHGDNCMLARWPDVLHDPVRWHYSRLTSWGVLPRFLRCRTLPVVMMASLVGWFVGLPSALALERELRQPEEPETRTPDAAKVPAAASALTSGKPIVSPETDLTKHVVCLNCGAMLPEAEEGTIGRCAECGSEYEVVRVGDVRLAKSHGDGSPAPRRGRRWLLPVCVLTGVGTTCLVGGRAVFAPLLVLAFLGIPIATLTRLPAKRWNESGRRQVLAVLYLAVAMLMSLDAWDVWSRHHVMSRIAAVITPYPGTYDPVDARARVSGLPLARAFDGDAAGARDAMKELRTNTTQNFIVSTSDRPERVLDFYRDPSHRPGLELVEDDTVILFLRGNGRDVSVGAMDQGYGRGVNIFYSWSTRR